MGSKTFLSLSQDALEIIEANASARKRGDFVSRILEDYARRERLAEQPTEGLLESMAQRLERIERAVVGK